MEKLLALLGVFLLLTCAQGMTGDSYRNKNREPYQEDQETEEEKEEDIKEEKERGEVEDKYKGWDYDEGGHTSPVP